MVDAGAGAPVSITTIQGLILAGGQSSRLRNAHGATVDKGLLPLRGAPLVAVAHSYLASQGIQDFFISANRNHAQYAQYGQLLSDSPAYQGCGPLAGIEAALSALAHTTKNWLLVWPVDQLSDNTNTLSFLSARASPAKPAYIVTADGPQPLCVLVHRSQLAGLRAYLERGSRRALSWLQLVQAQAVTVNDGGQWLNLNTAQDWPGL